MLLFNHKRKTKLSLQNWLHWLFFVLERMKQIFENHLLKFKICFSNNWIRQFSFSFCYNTFFNTLTPQTKEIKKELIFVDCLIVSHLPIMGNNLISKQFYLLTIILSTKPNLSGDLFTISFIVLLTSPKVACSAGQQFCTHFEQV